jgi:predicted MFS family arabinose efflux permease
MLACSIAAQIIAYRRNPIRQQIAGMVMLSIGLCLLAAAGSASSIVLLLIASVIGGLGHGMAFLGGLTEVNRLAPPDRHADVLSSFYVVIYLGVGVPVIGTGFLAAAFGLLPAVEVFAALVVPLCLIDLLLLSRRRQSRARSPV